MNSNLGQTGKSFTTSIIADDGSFSLNNLELTTNLSLFTANGYYFSEIYGELSNGTLSLQAISDISDTRNVNINVLTHLQKGRIENLASNGLSFQEADEQSKSELLTFLGVTDFFETDFENFDISVDEDYNAALLAFSIILQRNTMIWNERPSLTAELTELLSNLSSDFASDGQITSDALIDTLLYNISQINLIDFRKNIENRYSELGQTVTIPDFEKYIAVFQEKFSDNLYTSFLYPDMATPDPIMAPDSKLKNLLAIDDTIFQAGKPHSIAAIIPLNASLTIKFIAPNSGGDYTIGGPMHDWELINEYPNGFTLISQRQNGLMTMLLQCYATEPAVIEYYENSEETPTYTKRVIWDY